MSFYWNQSSWVQNAAMIPYDGGTLSFANQVGVRFLNKEYVQVREST